MSAPLLERKLRESVLEKRKYFDKVLSESAIWLNYLRTIDTNALFNEKAWMESMYFIWMNISSLFIFGLDPSELEPLDPEFNVRLPSLEEFKQGIKIEFEPVDVGEAYSEFYFEEFQIEVPPVLDFDRFIDDTIWPEYSQYFKERKFGKLIVGYTRYGEGYLDPPVIRDFLRATLYEIAKRRLDFARLRQIYDTIAERNLVARGMLEAVFNRLVLHYQVLFENFILDYNLLNYSKLCKRSGKSASVPVVTWRGEERDVTHTKFDEVNCGFILDVTPLNLGILMDRKTVFKPNPAVTIRLGTPVPAKFIDWKVRRMVDRYHATGVGFGNYQRPDETLIWYRSERADHHHQLRSFFYYLDAVVDAALENENVDVFKLNLYRRAVSMLIGHKKKRHEWGYAAYESMNEDEFKEWWLSYWERQGLNRTLLEKIYERVKPWLNRARSDLKSLGESLSKRRKQLAKVLMSA